MFAGGSSYLLIPTHTPTHIHGFLPINVCRYPTWKNVIPKGQFIRIQRNCDRISDYLEQSNIFIQRLVDKKYQMDILKVIKKSGQYCEGIPHWGQFYLGDHNLSIERPQT